MKEEFISDFIPGVRAHISIGNNTSTWVGSNLHFHNEFELIKVLEGKLRVKTGRAEFFCEEGEIVVIDSRVPHQTEPEQDCPMRILLIQFDLRQTYDSYLLKFKAHSEQEYCLIKKNHSLYPEIDMILQQLSEEYINHKPACRLYLKAWIYTLLGFLTRNCIILSESSEYEKQLLKKISPLIDFVETNYNHDISLETAGKLLNLHPAYFCKIFKEATGETFTGYLNFVRVSKAEQLLVFTNKSVTEIACETGFSNIQYFNRIFKSVRGITPSNFRKLQLQSVKSRVAGEI